jgi:ketosteroid isomerase-like protein
MKGALIAAAFWCAALVAAQENEKPPQVSRDAAAEILRLDAEWARAAESGDLERILAYWSDDATVLPPGSPALVGKAAIREYVARSLQMPGFRISWKTNDVEVAASGDLAYGVGTNRASFDGPDGKPVVVEGKAVTVWRKDAAGWKCVVDIWNDLPAAK